MSKSFIQQILRENLQQADKIYFKTGKLSEKAKQIILMITKGDPYTKLVTDMYYADLMQGHKTGQWALKSIDDKHVETDSPESDVLDNNSLKDIQALHQDLVNYNKNVFPIKGFNINGVENIYYFMTALKQRRLILKMFAELPSIASRNMKADIRTERTYPELQKYRSDLEYFMAYYSQLSNRDEAARAKIEGKMFKNGVTLDQLLDFAQEKENLVGGTKFTKKKVKEIVQEGGYDLEIVYEKGDVMIIEVSGPDGIKKIGCNSLWCFTYGSGFNDAWRQWNNYSTNGLVYVIIDFKESPDSKDFMHVLIKPLQDEYDEDEMENPTTLFDMSNDVQYDTNGVISHLMDFETAKKVMNFGEEPEEDDDYEEDDETPKKEVPYKDPNQLSLFEIRQRLRESLLPEAKAGKTITAYHGSPKRILKFVDEFVGGEQAADQEGPGIYFTSSFDNARMYGEYVHKVTLTPRKLLTVTPSSNKMAGLIEKMVMMASDWEMHAQDYDENPRIGLRNFVKSTIDYNDTEKDIAQQIWIDFYRYEPVDFVRNMVKMGIDGLMIPKDNGVVHYIIYNPAIINIEE